MHDDLNTPEFIQLYTQHERDLFRYAYSLCPNAAEAQDIVQEASLALWDKFEQYDTSRPFLAWAFRFVFIQVLKHREKQGTRRKYFSDEVVESLAQLKEEKSPQFEKHRIALNRCMTKLSNKQIDLLKLRYEKNVNLTDIAESLNCTRNSLYKTLQRTREILHQCIKGSVHEL